MPLTATLVECTPYRLRYLVTQTGNPLPNETLIIPNSGPLGATPDLRVDSGTWKGEAMNVLVSTPVPTVMGTGDAESLLMGDFDINVSGPLGLEKIRSHLYITPRTVSGSSHAGWSVTADEGGNVGVVPSTGFAVIVVNGPGFTGETAYVDLDFEHTYDR